MRWLRDILKSSYTRMLEQQCAELKEELARLRQENRGLVNSLLGTAGFPPMAEERNPGVVPALRRRSLHRIQADTERESLQRIRERTSKIAAAEDQSGQPQGPGQAA